MKFVSRLAISATKQPVNFHSDLNIFQNYTQLLNCEKSVGNHVSRRTDYSMCKDGWPVPFMGRIWRPGDRLWTALALYAWWHATFKSWHRQIYLFMVRLHIYRSRVISDYSFACVSFMVAIVSFSMSASTAQYIPWRNLHVETLSAFLPFVMRIQQWWYKTHKSYYYDVMIWKYFDVMA